MFVRAEAAYRYPRCRSVRASAPVRNAVPRRAVRLPRSPLVPLAFAPVFKAVSPLPPLWLIGYERVGEPRAGSGSAPADIIIVSVIVVIIITVIIIIIIIIVDATDGVLQIASQALCWRDRRANVCGLLAHAASLFVHVLVCLFVT